MRERPPKPSESVSGVAFSGGVFSHLNRDAYVPAFYLEPSGAVTIAEVTSLFMPEILLAESTLSLKGDEQAVARTIPSCFPESACRSVAIVLTAPADGGDPELPATK